MKGANKLLVEDLIYDYKKSVKKGSVSIADSPFANDRIGRRSHLSTHTGAGPMTPNLMTLNEISVPDFNNKSRHNHKNMTLT